MDIQDYLSDQRTAYHAKEYVRLQKEMEKLDTLEKEDLGELVEEEQAQIAGQMEVLLEEMKGITAEAQDRESFPDELVLEIRAGAGGDEASIFARNLADMYEKYAAQKDFQFMPINISKNNIDGYKEASFRLKGKGVYKILRNEIGVHRIQRVPVTEKSGRVHTSTASVAILPIRKQRDVTLQEKDLKIEFSRSSGAGGQNVNKVESAVRIIHIPTGLDVRCTQERTQLRNREQALVILSAKVEQLQRERENERYSSLRKNQIGTQDRSEKIRTYNVLQDRVTDHRIKKSWSNMEKILAGGIDAMLADVAEGIEKQNDAA